jgi:hypothetical protein
MLGPCRTAREIYWFGTAPSGHWHLDVHSVGVGAGALCPRRRCGGGLGSPRRRLGSDSDGARQCGSAGTAVVLGEGKAARGFERRECEAAQGGEGNFRR